MTLSTSLLILSFWSCTAESDVNSSCLLQSRPVASSGQKVRNVEEISYESTDEKNPDNRTENANDCRTTVHPKHFMSELRFSLWSQPVEGTMDACVGFCHAEADCMGFSRRHGKDPAEIGECWMKNAWDKSAATQSDQWDTVEVDCTILPTAAPSAAPTSRPTAAPTSRPTAAPTAEPTPRPTPAPEVPKCTGCTSDGNGPMECWRPCGGAGYCSSCDSKEGTKGACCGADMKDGKVVKNPNDPPACNVVAPETFKYTGYHMCVLTEPEVPKCTGCTVFHGWGPMECWGACQEQSGYCGNCDSKEGTLGACCMITDQGKHVENDKPECKQIPISAFQYKGYHQCVLTSSSLPRGKR